MPIEKPKTVKLKDVELDWDAMRVKSRNRDYINAQKMLDSEVLKHCQARVPFDEGTLTASGYMHTVIGSGRVVWRTPYARHLYYNPQFNFQGAPMRGGQWFERMKADMGNQLIYMAKRLAGGD